VFVLGASAQRADQGEASDDGGHRSRNGHPGISLVGELGGQARTCPPFLRP